jgi:hypothetical protein
MAKIRWDAHICKGQKMTNKPEPQDVRRDANVETVAAVRKAIKEAWLVDGDKTDFDADRLALAAIAALAQSDAQPNPPNVQLDDAKVICPNCVHQFRAISVADQVRLSKLRAEADRLLEINSHMLRLEEDAQGTRAMLGGYQMPDALIPSLEAQSDAQPVGWPTDKQVRTACEAYNAECWRTTNKGFKPYEHLMEAALKAIAPPRPDASGLIEAAEWHEVTARHAEEMAAASDNHPDFVKAAEIHRYSADVFRNWIERARAADRSAHGEAIPDCPTEGIAARQGNGG